MYIYNVTIKINHNTADEWLTWMKNEHIPAVMETNCFTENRLCRLLDEGDLEGVTFVIQYICDTLDRFMEYKTNFSPALQKFTHEKFGNDFMSFRTLMEII